MECSQKKTDKPLYKEGEEEGLGRLEGFWQHNLATFEETGGINRRDEMTVRRN